MKDNAWWQIYQAFHFCNLSPPVLISYCAMWPMVMTPRQSRWVSQSKASWSATMPNAIWLASSESQLGNLSKQTSFCQLSGSCDRCLNTPSTGMKEHTFYNLVTWLLHFETAQALLAGSPRCSQFLNSGASICVLFWQRALLCSLII